MASSRLILSRIGAAYRSSTVVCAALFAAYVLVWAAPGFAQDLSTPLSLDPAIRTGRLANGLTYFIRRNAKPEQRVLLRLVVKAGSIDEADDQRGLAHMLEHMAFNGGTHFAPGELVKYLESIGARFGPHVNAYTSYDETVYMLDVPTDREGALVRGFQALSDFAGGISLDEREIDRERGVVIEEWRGRQGAATRMQQPQMNALFGASRYADRLPIGTPEVLQSFPAARLRDFYRDHYRADRMAVIAVGDADVDALEALVRTNFDGLATRAPEARPEYPIPEHQETRFVAVSDPEAQGSSVTLMVKRPREPFGTLGDYRRAIIRSLVSRMLNERLSEIARQPEAPFLRAGAGDSELGRTVESFSVSARVNDGGVDRGLSALAQELSRVRQFGFGEAELERAKLDVLTGYERAYNERNTSESASFAQELIRHVLSDEPVPGIEAELAIVRQLLPQITSADAASLARDALGEQSRVVLATSPQKEGVTAPTESSLRAALAAGTSAPVTAWRDATEQRPLLERTPVPGTVRDRREIPELGVTVLTLSNGVEVWLKPTDFRADQVLFTSYALGGTSLATPENYFNASLSDSLVSVAGVGGFTPVDLGKILTGKTARAAAYVTTYTQGVSGSASPRDLETALQLVYLQFTAPNRDPEAFVLMKERLRAGLANQAQNPGSVFGERVRMVNTLDHYTSKPLTVDDLDSLDPRRMLEFYDARFANAADFTFFFVGSFKVDEVVPMLTTYLASLPSSGARTADMRPLDLRFPDAVRRETVRKGLEPRSQTAITFFADTGLDEIEAHRARAAASVLEIRLRDLLREELGGTYSVGVGYSDTAPARGYGSVGVRFGSSPDNAAPLTQAVLDEVERLKKEGPSAADVQAVKESEKNDLQTSFRQNGFWMNSLQASHILRRDPLRILQRVQRAESLTQENIHAALQKYLPSDRFTVVTLMPEAGQLPASGAP